MRDLVERRAARQGEINLAELLRRSLDPDRVRDLIAQAAALGHEEAEQWREEFEIEPVELPEDPHKWLYPLGDSVLRLYACDCAERVLHLYEREYPDDSRPRESIEAARRYARGEISEELLYEAGDAARGAWDARPAREAARSAASAAASDAAWAAGIAAAWAAGTAASHAAMRAEIAAQRRIAADYLWKAIEDPAMNQRISYMLGLPQAQPERLRAHVGIYYTAPEGTRAAELLAELEETDGADADLVEEAEALIWSDCGEDCDQDLRTQEVHDDALALWSQGAAGLSPGQCWRLACGLTA